VTTTPDHHFDESVIEAYLLSKLPTAQIQQMEEHLLWCNVCLDVVDELEAVMAAIHVACQEEKVRRFLTHLPLYGLEAAAGKFGKQQVAAEPEGWVQPFAPLHIRLTLDMFVVHIKGCSMEPSIPDGSLCIFRSKVPVPYDGKLLLMEDYSETGGNRHSVKRYRSSKNADPKKEGEKGWLHERITLESINPAFKPWDVASSDKVHVIGEFVFAMKKRLSFPLSA
jgi:SOS-response transcriptional repressor LexA